MVSACLVTDGAHDMQPVLDSLPPEWEIVVYDNGRGIVTVYVPDRETDGWKIIDGGESHLALPDLSVYGRYAAIAYASHDLIYVQDDDVIVSDPQAIVDAWLAEASPPSIDHYDDCGCLVASHQPVGRSVVVCNMPEPFRANYDDAALVGFGAAFHRDAPARAFARLEAYVAAEVAADRDVEYGPLFWRECDRAFTVLTPRVLVDVPKTDREFASDPDRLWQQPDHHHATKTMLDLARKVRDS